MADKELRLAIVDKERCKPKKCSKECKNFCPINRSGKDCIRVTKEVAIISEAHCIGCGMCVRKCPFKAIQVINLPSALASETTHRYGRNGFKLHRLPNPRYKEVLGLVGQNGIGKSTAFSILRGQFKPNFGRYGANDQLDWVDIIKKFKGSDLQNYLTKLAGGEMRVISKPQSVDLIAKTTSEPVGKVLRAKCQRNNFDQVIYDLDLGDLLDRPINKLSGGELQRFAIAMIAIQEATTYLFDEPSSYLDIGQRMNAAKVIRDTLACGDYVIAIEHDLALIDYMSNYISVLYGQPGAFGVISAPFSVREGINHFLEGFIPTENMRFRDEKLTFRITDDDNGPEMEGQVRSYMYPSMKVEFGSFELAVDKGQFQAGEIVVLLGRNGVGKTTFIRMLAGVQEPTSAEYDMPKLSISYKPQKIEPAFNGTVEQLLHGKIGSAMANNIFKDMVVGPLNLDYLMDRKVKKLSGGEKQRVAIALALGKNADVYLIDEPSAYLDAEQRVIIAKILKRYILNMGKCAFIVEHDFMMATYLADRVVVFDGRPAVSTIARAPQRLVTGMNYFLKQMQITLRKDPISGRPRINKYNSVKDRTQKQSGNYFVLQ